MSDEIKDEVGSGEAGKVNPTEKVCDLKKDSPSVVRKFGPIGVQRKQQTEQEAEHAKKPASGNWQELRPTAAVWYMLAFLVSNIVLWVTYMVEISRGWYGPKMEVWIVTALNVIGWIFLSVLIIGIVKRKSWARNTYVILQTVGIVAVFLACLYSGRSSEETNVQATVMSGILAIATNPIRLTCSLVSIVTSMCATVLLCVPECGKQFGCVRSGKFVLVE